MERQPENISETSHNMSNETVTGNLSPQADSTSIGPGKTAIVEKKKEKRGREEGRKINQMRNSLVSLQIVFAD